MCVVCVCVFAWGIHGRVKRREVIGCRGDKWKEEGVEIGGWEVIFIVILVFEAWCWLLLPRSDFVRGMDR